MLELRSLTVTEHFFGVSPQQNEGEDAPVSRERAFGDDGAATREAVLVAASDVGFSDVGDFGDLQQESTGGGEPCEEESPRATEDLPS